MTVTNTAAIPSRGRTDSYVMTVRMVDGKVHPEDATALTTVKQMVKQRNVKTAQAQAQKLADLIEDARLNGWKSWWEDMPASRFRAEYVKLQGRLGRDNPNAAKYGRRRNRYQCILLGDAAFADVYIYRR